MNSDQCNLQTAGIAFPIDNQNYNQMNNQYITQNTEMMNKYPRNEFNIQQNNELYRQMQSKTNEYATLLNTIKSEKNNNVITYQQMNEDLHGIENTNKSNALLWGLSSIVLIGIVITVRNGIKY
jgi:elongation factor P--beta-lysine ligase